jgi:hypothetical protein
MRIPSTHRAAALSLASLGALAGTASAQSTVIISDTFETDTSADYTIVDDGTPNGTQAFNWDYAAAGIPLAPRSQPGDASGLRLTANDTDGSVDAWTLFHNTAVQADFYTLTVDVFMNWGSGSGTTEHAHVGVGGDGSTFNQLFSPISGSGAFIAFSGDGGTTSDYRWFRDANNTPTGETDNTTLPNDHPSYLGHGSNNTGSFFQSLFPSPPATVAGSPGNIWTTLKIEVDNLNGIISFYFDDQLTFEGLFSNEFNGFVSLGMADVFTSVATGGNFTLYDNLQVEVPSGSIGTNYCAAANNSTGMPAAISAVGSNSASNNSLVLTCDSMPSSQFSYFICGQASGFIAGPGGSQGNLCILGQLGRFRSQIQNTGTAGSVSITVDLTSIPVTPVVAVQPGDTWFFQAWYRDNNPTPTSNFSDGIKIDFQ